MNSDLAKVLHPVADRAMVHWVIDVCDAVGCEREVVVVGHQAETVSEEISSHANVTTVEQTEQNGTGHAVMVTEESFGGELEGLDVFVLCGDGPLIRQSTLETLLRVHRESGVQATLATAVLEDATGYGRIVRTGDGAFERIVEQKDASEEELAIREVNPSYYCFKADALFDALGKINNENANGEYYLTDVLGIMVGEGGKVMVVDAVPSEDVLSINTPDQLKVVDGVMRERLALEMSE